MTHNEGTGAHVAGNIAPDPVQHLGVARLLAPVMPGERAHKCVGHDLAVQSRDRFVWD